MNISDQENLIEAWVSAQVAGTTSEIYENNFWAIEKLFELSTSDPELLWEIILEIIKHKKAKEIIGILAASTLEDLMCSYGEELIERVENEANQNKLFKECMKGVWLDSNDTIVYKKFYEIAEIEPPFDE